jgi:hypothetical protein
MAMSVDDCDCEYFFVAEVSAEAFRVRLRPTSLEGLRAHVGNDKEMALGLLLEVARTLGQMGFVASREGVTQAELKVADPMKVLSGEQSLPWRLAENSDHKGITMYCCEGHGRPYYCTARN